MNEEIEILRRSLKREQQARKEAEDIAAKGDSMRKEIEALRLSLAREQQARKQAEHIAEYKRLALNFKSEDLETALTNERNTRNELEILLAALEAFTTKLDTMDIVKCLHKFINSAIISHSMTLYLLIDNRVEIINIRESTSTEHSVTYIDKERSSDIWTRLSAYDKPSVIEINNQQDIVNDIFETRAGTHTLLVAPLMAQGQILGYLTVENNGPGSFNDNGIRFVSALANEASIALENAKLFNKVERLSLTDPLTGLRNRRSFEGDAKHNIDVAVRHSRPLCIMMMDIDHFKLVNDTYGHATGDEVLTAIASVCREIMRKTDLLARFGGEEFSFLLPETYIGSAKSLAERLRAAIAEITFASGDKSFNVTVSIGITSCSGSEDSLKNLLKRSDEALYQAKNSGRNRVVVWSSPLSNGIPV